MWIHFPTQETGWFCLEITPFFWERWKWPDMPFLPSRAENEPKNCISGPGCSSCRQADINTVFPEMTENKDPAVETVEHVREAAKNGSKTHLKQQNVFSLIYTPLPASSHKAQSKLVRPTPHFMLSIERRQIQVLRFGPRCTYGNSIDVCRDAMNGPAEIHPYTVTPTHQHPLLNKACCSTDVRNDDCTAPRRKMISCAPTSPG
jgi:hypothetical protein